MVQHHWLIIEASDRNTLEHLPGASMWVEERISWRRRFLSLFRRTLVIRATAGVEAGGEPGGLVFPPDIVAAMKAATAPFGRVPPGDPA
jgi:hypothetical protein